MCVCGGAICPLPFFSNFSEIEKRTETERYNLKLIFAPLRFLDLSTVLRLLKQLRSARLNGCMMIFKVFFLTPTFFERRFLMWIQTIKLPEFWFDFLDDEFWFWFVLFLVRFFVFFPPLTIVISIFFIRYITLLIFPWTFWINKLKGVVLEKLGRTRILKVSKSQKHFFLKRNIKQNSPLWSYIVHFLSNEVSRKIPFEIYWPLV